jgi:PKD repeat protein
MRRLALTFLVLAALFAPATASAASFPVSINGSAPVYTPDPTTIAPGDTVVWTHNEGLLSERGVEFDDESGSTATCKGTDLPGSTCSRTFPSAGRFFYLDQTTCSSGPASACSVHGEIIVYVPPTASFTMSAASVPRGQNVGFDGSGSVSPGGTITSYAWNFGDGGTATGPAATHAYGAAGTYTVSLTVTDDQGKTAVTTQAVTVTVPDSDGDGIDDDHDACPLVAAALGCPLPAPIATQAVAAKAVGLQGALKSGVSVVVSCSDTCTAAISILPVTNTAQLPDTLATQTVTITGGGTRLVTLAFPSAVKAELAKLNNPRIKVQAVLTDLYGRVQTRVATLALNAVKTYGKLPAVGISDEQVTTFTDPLFQVLRLRFARYVTPWNAIFTEPDRLDAWLQSARAAGVRPLVSFEHKRSDQCPRRPCRPPSVGQYKRAWRAFHRKYPWVKDISPWNEANSSTQPTGKRPDLAAAYYNVVRASCRGCTIVAADVLDLNNMRRYLYAFLAKAKGKPRLWGLHNYRDTNRFRTTGTRQLLAAVKGSIWFTETGGIVSFTTQGGKKALPHSEKRAKKAMDFMFKLAELDAKRVKRIYVYQWKVNFKGDRFDAGVVRPDGTPRPSYDVLALNASIARKR